MAYDKIPIVVALWDSDNFAGRRTLLTEDTPDLGVYGFTEITSAIGIHPGPDYDPSAEYIVSFYRETDYRGAQLILTPGAYPDLDRPYNFSRVIQSVKFGQGISRAPTVSSIPVVAELWTFADYKGNKLIILHDVPNLHTYAELWGDNVSSARILQGPNYVSGKKARLYRGTNYRGGGIQLDPGDYPNLAASHGFDDEASSVKVS